MTWVHVVRQINSTHFIADCVELSQLIGVDVTNSFDDVTDSAVGLIVSDGDFGSKRFTSSPSDDTRQTQPGLSATYS